MRRVPIVAIPISILLLSFASNMALAGSTDSLFTQDTPRVWVMGVPQHLFRNGIKVEVDRMLSSPRKWLILSPTIYYRNKKGNWLSERSNITRQLGGGLDINYRYFITKKENGEGYHLTAGGGYKYIIFDTDGSRWDSYQQDGLNYHYIIEGPYSIHLSQANLRVVLGYHSVIEEFISLDWFIGSGWRYSHFSNFDNTYYHYNNSTLGFGATGFHVVAGLRIGVGW